ncbi:MAG: ribokinase [Hyphomicrobiaceae bacterium]|nr:ribokinase [Hyphomicrobiaceae bacterium]MCC0023950.1 ribokinase [Hyphomicrobiaceae bacterium]
MARIFVFGSINLDLIATTGRLPEPGETVPGTGFSTAPGGKGANQALAARRAGADVQMCGAVGKDDFAGQALALLEAGGVDLGRVRHVDGPTGIAIILVDAHGENVITIIAGANGTLDGGDAEVMLSGLTEGDILVCQQEVPTEAVAAALDLARRRNARSILNIAPIVAETGALAAKADIVVANETEFALLLGQELTIDQVADAASDYAKRHGQWVCVTLGGEGAVLATGDVLHRAAPLTISPVDTVGAGDTFCGYLAAALLEGADPEHALRLAAAAGSLACLKPGAQPAIPTRSEVDQALER